MIFTLIAAALLIAADQSIKFWAAHALAAMPGGQMNILPGVIRFAYVENTGAAFGLGSGMTYLFIAVTALVVAAIFIFLVRLGRRTPFLLRLSLTLIMAGGIGNLIDRVAAGYVVDMFEFQFVNFAVFNLADACVSAGTVLLFVFVLFFYERYFPEKTRKTPAAQDVRSAETASAPDSDGPAEEAAGSDAPEADSVGAGNAGAKPGDADA